MSRLLVRKSTDEGATWKTIDDFQLARDMTVPSAILVASNRTVFVAGNGVRGDERVWFVRRGDDDGERWSSSDIFPSPSGSSFAEQIAVSPSGDILVAGWSESADGSAAVVRRLACR
jgi:hypothetical protein